MSGFNVFCLRCLDRKNPYGIDENPTFSWKLRSDREDVFQASYQIVVKNENEIVWDSGIVNTDSNYHVEYEGTSLQSVTDYKWTVTVVDNYGDEASESGIFTTGLINKKEYVADFVASGYTRKPLKDSTDAMALLSHQIGSDAYPEEKLDSPVMFRRAFTIKKEKVVKKAHIFATSLGIYSLYVDGEKVSNILAPEYTSYNKHLEYQTYDITDIVKSNSNHAIVTILADGWYTGKIGLMGIGEQYGHENAMSFQVRIQYEDGSIEEICSDSVTKVNTCQYVYADLFVGEYVDFRKHVNCFQYDYDDSSWDTVKLIHVDKRILRAQSINPVDVLERITPTLIITPNGEQVLDAGKNIAGFTCFELDCEAGIEIGLEHSEILDSDGNFFQNITGQNKNQKDRVITASSHTSYEPQFTFHGFRYVKVTGLSSVNPENFTIYVIGNPMDKTIEFTCSDERINRLQHNIYNSQRGNMICIPTDCPQRERAGWTGDMEVYAPTATLNMDVQAFLRRWLYDVRKEQLEDGQIINVVPAVDSCKYVDGESVGGHVSSAGWGDAIVLVPYALYKTYGNIDVLRDNYSSMKKWMNYVEKRAGEDMLGWGKHFHFGDWLIPSIVASTGNPILTALQTKEEVALAYLVKVADCMGEIAATLADDNDAKYYHSLADKGRQVFSANYADKNGILKQQLQGLYVLALSQNLLDEQQREGAMEKLVQLVEEQGCLDTGFLSVPFLLDCLCNIGRSDLAYKILFDDEKPGWLYALKFDATTIWENWAAIRPDGTRTDSSYNHFAFGCVGDFLYRRIGGIQMEEVGFKKVRISPDFSCGLSEAKTEFESINGTMVVHWKKDDSAIRLKVQLPPNTSAVVQLMNDCKEVGNGTFFFNINE